MSKLDEADILRRSKADSLSVIKSLQCWGMKLKDVRIPVYFYLNPAPFVPKCTTSIIIHQHYNLLLFPVDRCRFFEFKRKLCYIISHFIFIRTLR